MQLIEKRIALKSKADIVYIYPVGDVHIGAFNCAEGHFKKFVQYIKKKKNSFWVGGGDYCNAITPNDLRRYDVRSLPDWIFKGEPCSVKEALCDVARQERLRFNEFIDPIKDKCLGLIEGNHESSLAKYSNNGHHFVMCDELKVQNLTDCAFIRLTFEGNGGNATTIILFIQHGFGGGRTAGAEPNHLFRLGTYVDADIILRGHSHVFDIRPSQPHLYVPTRGGLPDECLQREVFTANWGCWQKSYAVGAPTYDSQKAYPPRPLKAIEIAIKPFHNYNAMVEGKKTTLCKSIITMNECPFEME